MLFDSVMSFLLEQFDGEIAFRVNGTSLFVEVRLREKVITQAFTFVELEAFQKAYRERHVVSLLERMKLEVCRDHK